MDLLIFFCQTNFNIGITDTLPSFLGMNKCIITYFCQIKQADGMVMRITIKCPPKVLKNSPNKVIIV